MLALQVSPRLNQRPRKPFGFQTPSMGRKQVLRRPSELTPNRAPTTREADTYCSSEKFEVGWDISEMDEPLRPEDSAAS